MDTFHNMTCDGIIIPGKTLRQKFNYLVGKKVYTQFDKARPFLFDGYWAHINCHFEHDSEDEAIECQLYKLFKNNKISRLGFTGGNIYKNKKTKQK